MSTIKHSVGTGLKSARFMWRGRSWWLVWLVCLWQEDCSHVFPRPFPYPFHRHVFSEPRGSKGSVAMLIRVSIHVVASWFSSTAPWSSCEWHYLGALCLTLSLSDERLPPSAWEYQTLQGNRPAKLPKMPLWLAENVSGALGMHIKPFPTVRNNGTQWGKAVFPPSEA